MCAVGRFSLLRGERLGWDVCNGKLFITERWKIRVDMAASNFNVLLGFVMCLPYIMGTDGLLTEQELAGSSGLDLWCGSRGEGAG